MIERTFQQALRAVLPHTGDRERLLDVVRVEPGQVSATDTYTGAWSTFTGGDASSDQAVFLIDVEQARRLAKVKGVLGSIRVADGQAQFSFSTPDGPADVTAPALPVTGVFESLDRLWERAEGADGDGNGLVQVGFGVEQLAKFSPAALARNATERKGAALIVRFGVHERAAVRIRFADHFRALLMPTRPA